MEEYNITQEFKDELHALGCSYVDKIIVYKTEGDKVFFRANQCKFHLTKKELAGVIQTP